MFKIHMCSKQDSTLPHQAYAHLCYLHLDVTVQQFLHDLRLNWVRRFLLTMLFNS